MDCFLTLEKIGLLLNVLGSLFIAISVGKNPGEAYQDNEKGGKIFLATVNHPHWFRSGMFSMVFGFLLQFLSNCY